MLNLTKLYLYRMLRTKVAWVCMIILVGLTAFTLSVNYMIDKMTDSMAMDGDTSVVMEEEQPETETSILDEYMGVMQNGFPMMIFGIFAAIFYNSDEKHGYVKNIVTQYNNRSSVLLPRILSLGIYVLAVNLVNFLVVAILCKCFYPDMGLGLQGATLGYMGMHFLLLLTFLFIVQFITAFARGTALAVTYSVCASMNMAALAAMPLNFLARKFLHVQNPNVTKYFLDTYLFSIRSAEHTWSLLVLFVCYAGVAAALACLLLNKRDMR